MSDELVIERRGHTLVATADAGEENLYSPAMIGQLGDAIADAGGDLGMRFALPLVPTLRHDLAARDHDRAHDRVRVRGPASALCELERAAEHLGILATKKPAVRCRCGSVCRNSPLR